jgi:cytochrome c-type biogenesis protein
VRPAAFLTFALTLTVACRSDAPRVDIGLPVPAYSTLTLAGDSVSLASQRGKVVLLNVWATWCHPCRTEIPELIALYDQYRERGLELIGVTIDAEGADAEIRSFMDEFGMTFPIWHDPESRVLTEFLAIGVPSTFLIDKDGILRWRKLGPVASNDSTLARAIEKAISR